MASLPDMTPLQRRARAIERLDTGHTDLHASLEGLDPEEAFLGSRWSVWEVMNHLDTAKFVGALEDIAAGKKDSLPPFNSREAKLSPMPRMSFNVSVACMLPTSPVSAPSTPASAQLGTIPGGGGDGKRHR